jgi:hypothetical protein
VIAAVVVKVAVGLVAAASEAVAFGLDAAWAGPANTLLLIVLAVVTWRTREAVHTAKAEVREDLSDMKDKNEKVAAIAREASRDIVDAIRETGGPRRR